MSSSKNKNNTDTTIVFLVFENVILRPNDEFITMLRTEFCKRNELDEDNTVFIAAKNSVELVEKLSDAGYGNINWKSYDWWNNLLVILIPEKGQIAEYCPRRLWKSFVEQSVPTKSAFALWCEVLGLDDMLDEYNFERL
jgi:hypothetical protein